MSSRTKPYLRRGPSLSGEAHALCVDSLHFAPNHPGLTTKMSMYASGLTSSTSMSNKCCYALRVLFLSASIYSTGRQQWISCLASWEASGLVHSCMHIIWCIVMHFQRCCVQGTGRTHNAPDRRTVTSELSNHGWKSMFDAAFVKQSTCMCKSFLCICGYACILSLASFLSRTIRAEGRGQRAEFSWRLPCVAKRN